MHLPCFSGGLIFQWPFVYSMQLFTAGKIPWVAEAGEGRDCLGCGEEGRGVECRLKGTNCGLGANYGLYATARCGRLCR